jgi:hypothetical protein
MEASEWGAIDKESHIQMTKIWEASEWVLRET